MMNIQHFEAKLTEADSKKHIAHTFAVESRTTRIEIDLHYAPHRSADGYANMLTLSLFDPQGFRGAGHRGGTTHHVVLSAVEATPGYIPGALPSGTWTVVIDTHLVLPGEPVLYQLDVRVSSEPLTTRPSSSLSFERSPASSFERTPVNPRGKGWYRGDLHGHTFHSDGHWTPQAFLDYARSQKLDFITLSDHNTISGLSEWESLAANDLLTLGGFELTTFFGHALCLGTRRWLDWRVSPENRTMQDIAADAEAAGGTFIIAHPCRPGDPLCTGCHWDYPDMQPGTARIVEIWNEHWDSFSRNEDALALWYSWLNQGYRMVATSGSDIHGPNDVEKRYGRDVIYAEALTETALLNAVRQGHLYLSSGPHLELTALSPAGHSAMMGDLIEADGTLTVKASWSGCTPDTVLSLIVDGNTQETTPIPASGEKTWILDEGRWLMVELRDAAGLISAVSNPIFRGKAADWHR